MRIRKSYIIGAGIMAIGLIFASPAFTANPYELPKKFGKYKSKKCGRPFSKSWARSCALSCWRDGINRRNFFPRLIKAGKGGWNDWKEIKRRGKSKKPCKSYAWGIWQECRVISAGALSKKKQWHDQHHKDKIFNTRSPCYSEIRGSFNIYGESF